MKLQDAHFGGFTRMCVCVCVWEPASLSWLCYIIRL